MVWVWGGGRLVAAPSAAGDQGPRCRKGGASVPGLQFLLSIGFDYRARPAGSRRAHGPGATRRRRVRGDDVAGHASCRMSTGEDGDVERLHCRWRCFSFTEGEGGEGGKGNEWAPAPTPGALFPLNPTAHRERRRRRKRGRQPSPHSRKPRDDVRWVPGVETCA
ncbi:hypothetical protein DFH06DRAFT_172887 [Mycena polygramma]|nr:hypothetical protein DFH06DRAFT_172887 [Mycena polygramma]